MKDQPHIIQLIESAGLGTSLSFIGMIYPIQKFAIEILLDTLKKVNPLFFFETTWKIIQTIPQNPGSKEILLYQLGHVLGPAMLYLAMLVVPTVITWLFAKNIIDKVLSQYKMLLTEIKEKPIFSLLKALCFTLPLVIIGLPLYSACTHALYDL